MRLSYPVTLTLQWMRLRMRMRETEIDIERKCKKEKEKGNEISKETFYQMWVKNESSKKQQLFCDRKSEIRRMDEKLREGDCM